MISPRVVQKSMRLRLMVLMIGIFVLAAASAGYLINRNSIHELEEILNAGLAQNTRAMYQVLVEDLEQGNTVPLQKFADSYGSVDSLTEKELNQQYGDSDYERAEQLEYQRQIYIQVTNPRIDIDIYSHGNQLTLPEPTPDGYFTLLEDGNVWHFYSIANESGSARLSMGQRADHRDELFEEISETVLLPMLVLIPFLAYALWWGSGHGIRPLKLLSGEIGRRESDNLEPITNQYTTTETLPVVEALNGLLERLRGALANERRFTADASHELRTPIASIQVQLDVLSKANGDVDRQSAIDSMNKSTVRMSHLVEDLLALARLDGQLQELETELVDLRALIVDTIADVAFRAIEKHIEISFDGEKALSVKGNDHLHRLILNNLLSNAIKYTPGGGQINVTLLSESGVSGYAVEDTGPGVEPEKLQRITDRFFRVQNSTNQHAEGAGLGLSIADRAADLLGATLLFSNRDSGGLSVTVTVPDDGVQN